MEQEKELFEFFDELKKYDVSVYEVTHILREAFIRMFENEDFEDYTEGEIQSIVMLLTGFSKRTWKTR